MKLWGALVGVDFRYGQTTNLIIELLNVTAEYLSAGTVYKDLKSGLIYKVVSQAATIEGKISATVACSSSGPVGNLPAGTVLNIANPVDGIPSTATVSSISIEGTNDEDIETYRKRVLQKFRNKSQPGSPLDYHTWTMEVSGIIDALVYVLEEGVVTVYAVAEGSGKERTPSGEVAPNPFPLWVDGQFTELEGSGQMLAIANSIEGSEPGVHDRRPTMAKVDLKAPIYTPYTIEIEGLSDTSYNNDIKEVLISELDKKRPNIVVLNYPISNAKINRVALSSACTEVIGEATITSFLLKDAEGNSLNEDILGIGCLAYLGKLQINGEIVYSSDDEEVVDE